MRDMENFDGDTQRDEARDTSGIVRIAYRQSREMSGIGESADSAGDDDSDKSTTRKISCVARLTKLPIVASINSRISENYTSIKRTNSTVEIIIEKTEQSLAEGAKFVAPVTTAIGQALGEPLKVVDGAVCHAIDYLEDNVPSVKLPPAEMYDKLEKYVRNICEIARTRSAEFLADARLKLDELKKILQPEANKEPIDPMEEVRPKSG